MDVKTNPRVSIILPVYNAGVYLKRCIKSILNQTLREIELIIVLDCPTDGSDKVAKSYAKQDNRIRIIENEVNMLTGLSRNKGLDAAKGEYIGFCDHDDYLAEDMLEKMYDTAILKDADMVISNVEFVNSLDIVQKTADYPMDLSGGELKEHLLSVILKYHYKGEVCYGKYIWNMLFKRNFLQLCSIKFDNNKIITSEDTLFLAKIYFFTDKIFHCGFPDRFYKHVWHSSNTGGNYSYLNTELVLNYVIDLNRFLSNHQGSEKYRKEVAEGTVRFLYTTFRRELRVKGLINSLKKLSSMRKNEAVQQNLSVFFDKKNRMYSYRHLPITKFLFLLILYL